MLTTFIIFEQGAEVEGSFTTGEWLCMSKYPRPLHWRAGYHAPVNRLTLENEFECRQHFFTSVTSNFYSARPMGNTHAAWTGCLVVVGLGVWALIASAALSGALLRCWSLWKMLIPGWTRLRLAPSRMYTCSGDTSSQREPWKPERHTQVCGRLQEPRFWQGGWQSAEKRAQMDIKFSAGHVGTCAPPCTKQR